MPGFSANKREVYNPIAARPTKPSNQIRHEDRKLIISTITVGCPSQSPLSDSQVICQICY